MQTMQGSSECTSPNSTCMQVKFILLRKLSPQWTMSSGMYISLNKFVDVAHEMSLINCGILCVLRDESDEKCEQV